MSEITFKTPDPKRGTNAISDNTCPADKFAKKRKPKLSDRKPIEINSRQMPRNNKILTDDDIRNSEIDRNEYREYFDASTIRFKNTEDRITATMLVQNSASEVERFNKPAKLS